MSKQLKTLIEYNNDIESEYKPHYHYNNIACPNCGEELVDSNPLETLMSFPPQKKIHCIKEGCKYSNYRLA
jgi:C4-type Zn-finger protein